MYIHTYIISYLSFLPGTGGWGSASRAVRRLSCARRAFFRALRICCVHYAS